MFLQGGESKSRRVVRGGSWNNNNPTNFRAANRNRNQPDNRNNNLGFRCAKALDAAWTEGLPPESLPLTGGGSVHPGA
jgi:hypothetical protein